MRKVLVLFSILVLIFGCSNQEESSKFLLKKEDFNKVVDGKQTGLFFLKNKNGLEVALTNYGARIIGVMAPDINGEFADVIQGFPGLDPYIKFGAYNGGTIGRFANRIAYGKFSLNGVEYSLAANNGQHHLHGGAKGFHQQVWDVDFENSTEILFRYISPDMDGGYPGTVNVSVKYRLTDDNSLEIEYKANTDKTTILNLTNHAFFNLRGIPTSGIKDYLMYINADYFTPVDSGFIPTGELADVINTPFDFRIPTSLGARIDSDNSQFKLRRSYDHNWVLNTNGDVSVLAAKVVEPVTGRVLEVYTSEPGVQFFSGNFSYAFCLETQHFPDSPNKPDFPSVVLNPGQEFHSITIYKFTVVDLSS